MALSFPPDPPLGTVYENWIWNGTMWVCVTPAAGGGNTFTAPFNVYNDSAQTELALWSHDGQAGIQAWPSATALIIEPDTGQAVIGSHLGVAWLNFDPMAGLLSITGSGSFNIANGNLTVNGSGTFTGPLTASNLHLTDGTTVNDLLLSAPGITINGDGSGSLGTAPNQLVWDASGTFSTTGSASLPGGGGGGGATDLAHLTDVSLIAQTDGQVLAWNATTQRWVNSAPGGTASLGQLSDVSIAMPTAGQQLVWNGTNWVNQTPPPPGGTGTVTAITAGTGLTGGTINTSGIIGLMNTPVQAGAYTSPNLTIDAQGRITAAANGSLNSLLGPMTPTAGQLLGFNGTRWINVPAGAAAGTLAGLNDVSVGNLVFDQVLSWNGAYWTNRALPLHTLASLDDTEIAGAALGQVLTWDGTKWQNQNPPYGGAANLSQLFDVSVTGGQTNGQVLTWDAVAGKWVAANPAGAGTLSALADVSVPAPTINQVLTWNGSQWVAQAPAPSGVTSITPNLSGVFLQSGLILNPSPIVSTGSIGVDWAIVPNLGTANTFTQANSFVSSLYSRTSTYVGGLQTMAGYINYVATNAGGPQWPTWRAGMDVFPLTTAGITDTARSWGIKSEPTAPGGWNAILNLDGKTGELMVGYATTPTGTPIIPGSIKVFGPIDATGLPSIQTHIDVGAMTPTTGDVLMWVGSRWDARPESGGGGGGGGSLSTLSDVTLTTPAAGQVLSFDGTHWVNAAGGGGGGVSLSTPNTWAATQTFANPLGTAISITAANINDGPLMNWLFAGSPNRVWSMGLAGGFSSTLWQLSGVRSDNTNQMKLTSDLQSRTWTFGQSGALNYNNNVTIYGDLTVSGTLNASQGVTWGTVNYTAMTVDTTQGYPGTVEQAANYQISIGTGEYYLIDLQQFWNDAAGQGLDPTMGQAYCEIQLIGGEAPYVGAAGFTGNQKLVFWLNNPGGNLMAGIGPPQSVDYSSMPPGPPLYNITWLDLFLLANSGDICELQYVGWPAAPGIANPVVFGRMLTAAGITKQVPFAVQGAPSTGFCLRADQVNSRTQVGDGSGYGGAPAGFCDWGQRTVPNSGSISGYDRGKGLFLAGATAGQTLSIPASNTFQGNTTNLPIGSVVKLINVSSNSWNIAPSVPDTLSWWPSGGTGTRTLASSSIATLFRLGNNTWVIDGYGIT
jgi:hypothetical protein